MRTGWEKLGSDLTLFISLSLVTVHTCHLGPTSLDLSCLPKGDPTQPTKGSPPPTASQIILLTTLGSMESASHQLSRVSLSPNPIVKAKPCFPGWILNWETQETKDVPAFHPWLATRPMQYLRAWLEDNPPEDSVARSVTHRLASAFPPSLPHFSFPPTPAALGLQCPILPSIRLALPQAVVSGKSHLRNTKALKKRYQSEFSCSTVV